MTTYTLSVLFNEHSGITIKADRKKVFINNHNDIYLFSCDQLFEMLQDMYQSIHANRGYGIKTEVSLTMDIESGELND